MIDRMLDAITPDYRNWTADRPAIIFHSMLDIAIAETGRDHADARAMLERGQITEAMILILPAPWVVNLIGPTAPGSALRWRVGIMPVGDAPTPLICDAMSLPGALALCLIEMRSRYGWPE